MANQAAEKDFVFGASPIGEESSSSQTHLEELVMGPGTVTKQQRDSKGAEEHPSTSRSHGSADHNTMDSCPPAMPDSLRPFPTDGEGISCTVSVEVSKSSNSMEIEETVTRSSLETRRIQNDGPDDDDGITLQYDSSLKPNDHGSYLWLNDRDLSDDPYYRLEMSKFLPDSGNIRKKYEFHWKPIQFQAGLLTVLGYYVALDTSVAKPKNLIVVAKRPADDGAALLHRDHPQATAPYCMLYFKYKGETYQVKVEDGVPIVEKLKPQESLKRSYMWIASL